MRMMAASRKRMTRGKRVEGWRIGWTMAERKASRRNGVMKIHS